MRSLSVVLVVTLLASSLEAQVSVEPGARIRFTGAQLREHEVTVLERRGDSLRVVPKRGTSYTVAAKDLGHVRVSLGKSHLLGMGTGALWGAGVGTGLGLLTASDAECDDYCGDAMRGVIVASSALAGSIFGGLIGAFVGKEAWADATTTVPRQSCASARAPPLDSPSPAPSSQEKTMRASPATLFVLALCVGRSVLAQPLQAPPGARVRLTLRNEGAARDGRARSVVAMHVETRGDSLRIVPAKGQPFTVSAAAVDRAWLSGGKNRLAGAGAGAFWGAGAGAVLGWVGGLVGPDRPGRPSAEELAQLTGLTSIWLGSLIGFAVGRETWSPVVLAPFVQRPEGTGLRFAARVAF